MRQTTPVSSAMASAMAATLAVLVVLGPGMGRSTAADATPAADLPAALTSDPAAARAAADAALGPPTRLVVESGRIGQNQFTMAGRDAREQLVVTAEFDGGHVRDYTEQVAYLVEPAGVVSIDATGLVTPLGNGRATITAQAGVGPEAAQAGEASATIEVEVTHFDELLPINFANQITPIFTKLGCNGGGCHGKASGQNGFKLSLLGFEPGEDFEYLVKEGRGRRLFPAAPDESLLLVKATNRVPHGGGARLDPESQEYRLLRRWVAQGMPYGDADDPHVVRIEVFPLERSMPQSARQQLTVVAHYSDGSIEDVTRVVQFDANDPEMADVTPTGLVHTLDLAGDVAIMARYQGHVAVFRASIPLGAPLETAPEPRGAIDAAVFAKLQKLGIPPSPPCDDATFIRRTSIDITGRLPTPEETERFLADTAPDKRDRWIDQLLDSGAYADYFANKWSAVLRNKRRSAEYTRGTFAFHAWIRESLYENKPYDEFVRGIVAAAGEVGQHPPVVWYREVNDVHQQVEDTAQLFLGLRIQCARCHHHPFEKWSQQDYYGFAAYFSRVGRKPGLQPGEQRIFHNRGQAVATNPKNNAKLPPTGLDAEAETLSSDDDPRHALVDWMADADNPFFARALVNRYWKHFFDRGIVDPEDDMRVTNPAANPELLDALAEHFVASGFDLKDLVRTICQSQTYQLDSDPNELNQSDKQNYSRFYPRRLTAEVLLDAINQVLGSTSDFSGLPIGTLAVELPDQAAGSYFLTVFGRPEADTACECERSQEANLAQSLHLLNSAEVQGKLSADGGRAALLAADERGLEERLREVYLWCFSREPDAEEVAIALEHLEKSENQRHAFEDILWALVNTKEFLFNH